MVSQVCKSILLNVVSSIFSGLALGLGISAIDNPNWIILATSRIGLFQSCSLITLVCQNTPDDPWIVAVRAFMIMMTIAVFIGIVIDTISSCYYPIILRKVAAVPFTIGGVFGVIAMVDYAATLSASNEPFLYGSSAVMGWVSAWCPFFAAIFSYLSASELGKKEAQVEDIEDK